MYLSIIFLPLLASATAGLLGRKLGNTGAQIITISSLSLTSIMVLVAFYEVGLCASPVYINLPSWIDSGLLNVSWSFSFDSLSVVMLIPILIVSTLVQIYTVDYMREDPHGQRFFSYLTLFSFFMILLVTADNYLLMFLAWEGVGVVSFLLINFWFTRIAAGKAAVLALTQNRVGDTLLTLGLFGIFWLFGNLDYATVFSIAPYMNETVITIIALLLLGGASAKSAQLLLNTWLPHSMEGSAQYDYKNKLSYVFYIFIIFFILNSLALLIDYFYSSTNLTLATTLPVLTTKMRRALTGDLLGDGHLRYGNRNKEGERTGNCNYSMTLKMKDYTYHLWGNIYKGICTDTIPNGWPPVKSGKPITQYHFATRSFKQLSLIHAKWYTLDTVTNQYTKIVPLNIDKLLSPIGLAHWIMGDGYWNKNTLCLCTDGFTYSEVLLLIKALDTVFNLEAGSSKRTKDNKGICWRIRLSSKKENIDRLKSIVLPFMIPTMKYKLGYEKI